MSSQPFDVLVIGAGPAGLAAAARAAECGAQVGIVDDNSTLGGQIWRESAEGSAPEVAYWSERLRKARVATLCGMRVFDHPESGVVLAEVADDVVEFHYKKLILATGARERFLPFPGWTLPNVMGAGGLQALVKSGLPIQDKRVVVAGTGPLLLAVAAYLRKHGAEIPIICEQVSWRSLARFGVALLRQHGKVIQGLQFKRELAGVPFATSSWPTAAHGKQVLDSVTISRGGKTEMIACDYLACGFHLVPNTELASLLGCELEGRCVRVDEFQRTSVPGVLCAGEPTGIGGVDLSLVEGQIAGLTATEHITEAQELFGERRNQRRFAQALEDVFRLRNELRDLPLADTIVCRCEDVPYSRLRSYTSWRASKLQTRCGMGPCQGRVCGPAVEFLLRWKPDSVRPPILPVRVESMAVWSGTQELANQKVTGGL